MAAFFHPHPFVHRQYVACLNCTRDCFSSHGSVNARPDINPSFLSLVTDVMVASHPDCCMMFPPDFADSVLSKCVGEAELEGLSGWVWLARLELDRSSMCLTNPGWGDFAMDNGLEVGDVVMFTYVGRNRFKIRAYDAKDGSEKGMHCLPTKRKVCDDKELKEEGLGGISPKLGSINKTQNLLESTKDGSPHQKAMRMDNKMYCKKVQKEGSRLPDPAESSTDCGKRVLTKCRSWDMSTCCSLRRYTNGYRTILHSHDGLAKDNMPDSPVLAPQCSIITDPEKFRVIKDANDFKSRYPKVRKLLKSSNVHGKRRLIFPAKFAKRYMPYKDARIKFVDPLGRKWDCNWFGSRMNDGNAAYVGGGWRTFVKDHGLQEHDICIFELTDSKKCEFNVHIFKVKPVHIPINLI